MLAAFGVLRTTSTSFDPPSGTETATRWSERVATVLSGEVVRMARSWVPGGSGLSRAIAHSPRSLASAVAIAAGPSSTSTVAFGFGLAGDHRLAGRLDADDVEARHGRRRRGIGGGARRRRRLRRRLGVRPIADVRLGRGGLRGCRRFGRGGRRLRPVGAVGSGRRRLDRRHRRGGGTDSSADWAGAKAVVGSWRGRRAYRR